MIDAVGPNDSFPNLIFTLTDGTLRRGGTFRDRWTMLVVYRGKHCPRCVTYINRLHELAPDYAARNVDILLASADSSERAAAMAAEHKWTLPIAHSLSVADMRLLGLYITEPPAGSDIPGPYAEPGLFLVNTEGRVHVLSTSNAASCRPDLAVFLDGVIGTQERNLPVRGLFTG